MNEVIFLNDLVRHDGWAQLAPYGDFPGKAIVREGGKVKRVDAVQRMDRAAADEMVREFKSLIGTAKRFVRGRKLFVGHPDVPGLEKDYPDATTKGVFVDLEAREDGLWGKPVLTEEGSALVENETYRALSPFWQAVEVGEERGVKIFRPRMFRSAGLTNRPNLPVRELMNEQTNNETNTMIRETVLKWLAALGVTVAADASDEVIAQAIASRTGAVANERTTAETALAAATAVKDAEIAGLKTGLKTIEVKFANERKARVALVLDQALAEGRVTPAERPAWAAKLEADLDSNLAVLANEKPKMKTRAETANGGARKIEIANVQERAAKVQGLVSKRMKEFGEDYDAAFANVRREQPALFAEMVKRGD